MGKHGKPLTVARYMTEKRPGHPVAHADGRVRVHRANLYDKIGEGPHPCTWCGRMVDWFTPPRLVSDHLDGDTWNNSPDNLVPSCNGCNSTRHNFQATHCKHGHEFTEENTYVRKDTQGTWPNRQCVECRNLRRRVAKYPRYDQRKPPKRVPLHANGLTLGSLRAAVVEMESLPDDTDVYVTYGEAPDGP